MTIQELPSYDLQELTDNMVAFFDESEEDTQYVENCEITVEWGSCTS